MIKMITRCDLLLSVELSVLEAKIFGTTWHPNTIKEKINSGEVLYWVYEIDNEIVAYLSIQKNIEGLHILAIGVKEEYRNQSVWKYKIRVCGNTKSECVEMQIGRAHV